MRLTDRQVTAHPYPAAIVEAVAKTLASQRGYLIPFEELNDYHKFYLFNDALGLLQALWEASRVDTAEQLEALPHKAVVIDRTGYVAVDYVTHNNIDTEDLPAHILHWGDSA